MTAPRLFLVMPDMNSALALACLKAAAAAGDVASLLAPPNLAKAVAAEAQALGIAVLTTGEARDAMHAGLDGLHVEDAGEIEALRKSLGRDRIIGAFAGHSRHAAMEAAEAGADYVALSQNGPSLGGEPLVKWWGEVMEIPAIAFDPVEASDLDILLPQKPDFIRPADAMWASPEDATRIIGAITERLKRT